MQDQVKSENFRNLNRMCQGQTLTYIDQNPAF